MPDLGKSQGPAFRKCRTLGFPKIRHFGNAGSRKFSGVRLSARQEVARGSGGAARPQSYKGRRPFSFQVCFFMIILGADVLDSVLDQKFSTSKTARPEIQYF